LTSPWLIRLSASSRDFIRIEPLKQVAVVKFVDGVVDALAFGLVPFLALLLGQRQKFGSETIEFPLECTGGVSDFVVVAQLVCDFTRDKNPLRNFLPVLT
jgi:hypothetical protein